MLKLTDNPMSTIVDFLKQHNPAFKPTDIAGVGPTKVSVLTGDVANSSMSFMMDPLAGYTGSMVVKYNRLDLSKALNKFGAITRYPTVRIFGNPGTASTVYGVIDQINNALGIKLNTSGNYRDIDDTAFTIPNKNTSVQIAINTNPGGVNGVPPFSLQLLPGTACLVNLFNQGYVLGGAAAQRNTNPFVNSSAGLAWKHPTANALANVQKTKALPLFNEDFSNIFSAYTASNIVTAVAGASNTVNFTLTSAFRTAINTRLTAAGVPLINTWVYNVHWSIADTAAEYYAARVFYTAGLTDVRVNKAFNSVMILEVNYHTVTAGWISEPYYLHFNR